MTLAGIMPPKVSIAPKARRSKDYAPKRVGTIMQTLDQSLPVLPQLCQRGMTPATVASS
ncbi:hypothetical protein H6F61_24120 [Cyanobacteria bacterium FACHB-472]|nr:hypothetical protein [Cyanobacteria bacterium FACHB-472]